MLAPRPLVCTVLLAVSHAAMVALISAAEELPPPAEHKVGFAKDLQPLIAAPTPPNIYTMMGH